MIRRREFLTASGTAILLASVRLGEPAASAVANSNAAIEAGNAAWNEFVNHRFYLYDATLGEIPLMLAAVREKATQAKLDQFTLTFLGSSSTRIAEGTYDLGHPKFGRFQLFLQPVGRGSQGQYYRADFNLLT